MYGPYMFQYTDCRGDGRNELFTKAQADSYSVGIGKEVIALYYNGSSSVFKQVTCQRKWPFLSFAQARAKDS